jgi:hypothetical protein
MIVKKWLAALALVATFGTALAEELPESWDGLVQVKPKRADAAFLLPGADFRPYTKVMLDPAQAAFQKDWLRSQNEDRRDLSRRIQPEDAEKILEAARTNFDEVFAEEFPKQGYPIATAPGPDVLRISTAVVNLYINAPDVNMMSAGRTTTYTTEAGEATLVLEARDSRTGLLMGRILDRRATRSTAGMQMSTSVSNKSDFRALFRQWAGIAVKGIDELKAHSPVPDNLTPNQKL